LNGKETKGNMIKAFAKHKGKKALGLEAVEVDEEAAEFIEVANVGEGDEFMAVLPWKGAIREPKNASSMQILKEKPDESYEIDFVYGYKSEEVRQNCFYNPRKKPVYMTAALGIIFDPKTRT
jgi:hypothetical protein